VVALSVRRLDPSEFTASTVVSIRFIGSALTNRQGKSILGEAAAFGSTRETGSAHGYGAISVGIGTEFGAVRFSIPVAEFDPVTTSATATVSIPVRGQPQYFPQDYYRLQAASSIQLPANVFVLPAGRSTPSSRSRRSLPSRSEAGWLTGARGCLVSNESPGATGQHYQDQASVELYRPAKFYLYVYAVVTSPVLLVLVYFMISIASGKAHGATSHFEFAVAILAIFTLREVFVPEGITSLTRLDHLLGLAVIGCILIAAFISLVEYQPAPRENSEAPGSTSSSTATLAAERPRRRMINGLIMVALLIVGRRASIRRSRCRRHLKH
jgi:hypothetical protein